MNYQHHYDVLIERARTRVVSGYVEVHHVVPRCMGGSDEKSNLVQLTAEEHFVAHQLLCKMYPNIRGLAFAMQAMTAFNQYTEHRSNNKLFGWVRKRYALAQKGRVKSPEERANIAEAGRNRETRIFSEEARANMAEARRKTWTDRRESGEHLLIGSKVKAKRIENGTYVFTEEHKRNIGLSSKGRPSPNKGKRASDETREKMRLAKLGHVPWNKGTAKEKVTQKLSKEEVSAIRKAASLKLWEKRKLEGAGNDIGKKASETRRANGNYGVSPEVRDKIRSSLMGNNNRVKNRMIPEDPND